MVLARPKILREADGDCVGIARTTAGARCFWSASTLRNALPDVFGDLGLPSEALSSHIAWDPGALAVARSISEALDAALDLPAFFAA